MVTSVVRIRWLAAMGVLLLISVLAACGDSQVREIVVTATPEPQVGTTSSGEVVNDARATATPAPASVPTPQPTTQTTTSGATPNPTPEAATTVPTPTPGLETKTTFGPGTWRIGKDIVPGVYQSEDLSVCRWERLRGRSGQQTDIIGADESDGIAKVAVLPSDAWFFASEGCGQWTLQVREQPTPWPRVTLSFQRTATLSADAIHTCALRPDGTAVCWGDDRLGQTLAPDDERFASINSGWDHTCALRLDGTAVCWGLNQVGQGSPPANERFALESADYEPAPTAP